MSLKIRLQYGNEMKIKDYITIILGTLLFTVCILSVMLMIDCYHVQIDALVEENFHFENHFSGSDWFSAILSCLTAVPGIFCGWFAIKQTERIKELESRYHRPALSLHSAELQLFWLDYISDSFQTQRIKKYFKQMKESMSYPYALRLELEFEAKNEIEVKGFEIEGIEFSIDDKQYNIKVDNAVLEWQPKDRKSFSRKFNSGKIVYKCAWELYPLSIGSAREKEELFWESMKDFVNYKRVLKDEYRQMEALVSGNISYEYSENEAKHIYCRVQWDAEEGTGRIDQFHGTQKTDNGFFSYDIK